MKQVLKRFFKEVAVVARYELADAVRSRRAAVVIVLYMTGAVVAMNGFISILHRLEEQIARTLGISVLESAGAVTDSLWRSVHFRNMIIGLVGDRDIAMDLLDIPPIALMFGWLAFTFTPMLVMLTTSARIADEIGSGSVRYSLQRCSRATWSLGKFAGQAGLVVLALLLSAISAWVVARIRLDIMDSWATAQAFMIFAGKAWIYSFAFIGLATGVSQMSRPANRCTRQRSWSVVWAGCAPPIEATHPESPILPVTRVRPCSG